MTELLKNLNKFLNDILAYFKDVKPDVKPMETPVTPLEPKYKWDSVENCRHSVRVIADEEGLTVAQKNMMCQVIRCESGFNPNVVNQNKNSRGKVLSTDFGICQWNDYYHGKEISPDEALHNPEKAVRLMCSYVRAGKINQWVCFSSSKYNNYQS